MASVIALGLKCMYFCVVAKSRCPATSWMARVGAPFIARCEQNVWRLCRGRHNRHHADSRIMPTLCSRGWAFPEMDSALSVVRSA
jgi:hypothetical protein